MDLEGVDWSVVTSKGIGDLLLWCLGFSVAGENHSLLCPHHKLRGLVGEDTHVNFKNHEN